MIRHLESANTMFSFIWWITGFYWVSAGGEDLIRNAPQLYWYFSFRPCEILTSLLVFSYLECHYCFYLTYLFYRLCIVFLAFDVFFVVFCVALACFIGIAVCCCLPCIIALLYAVVDQVNNWLEGNIVSLDIHFFCELYQSVAIFYDP
jgi:hypothetical protein